MGKIVKGFSFYCWWMEGVMVCICVVSLVRLVLYIRK